MTSKGLLAAFAASALALIAGVLMVGSASANPGTIALSADPGTIPPGGTSVVTLSVTPAGSETVAGVNATVTYDEADFTVEACTPSALCNPALGPGQVGLALFDASGLSGGEATITFAATDAADGASQIGVTINSCKDELAGDISCTGTGTTITVAEATATPTTAPTGTTAATTAAAAATTAAALPQTGGSQGSDTSVSALTMLAAALGLVVIAGGAWAVARARSE